MDESYQHQIWRGATAAARLLGVRLVALVGDTFDRRVLGAHPWPTRGSLVYKLAGMPEIDGYLPLVGALGNFNGIDLVENLLEWLPLKPTVCVGVPLPGYVSVRGAGDGIAKMVRHLVQVHDCREIVFLGGATSNPDALRRLSDFRETMREEGLAIGPDDELSGDFTTETARRLVGSMLDGGRRPRAILCANDSMAIGAHSALSARGFKVPDDVVLTGYDDSDEAKTLQPSLTTVAASAYRIGFQSVELLHQQCQGQGAQGQIIPTEFMVRRSCGCSEALATSLTDSFEAATQRADHAELDRLEVERLMRGQFQAVRDLMNDLSPEGFGHRLLAGLRSCVGKKVRVLLFRKDFGAEIGADFESGNYQVELDAESGYIGPLRDGPIPSDPAASSWCVLPLLLGDEYYGVVQLRDWNAHETLLEGFRQAITFVLSAAHNASREARVREECRLLSVRDELTGLFNRRGLLEQGSAQASRCLRERACVGVALCDFDGLKELNDRFGRKQGDLAIQLLAGSLVAGFRHSDIIGRLGGGEFAILAMMKRDGSLDDALDRVREAILEHCREAGHPWRAQANAGWVCWDPNDGSSLESVLAQADHSLYRDRKRKKDEEKAESA